MRLTTVVGNCPQLHTTQHAKRNQDQPALRIDADVRGSRHVPDEPFVAPICDEVYGRIGPAGEENPAVRERLDSIPLPVTAIEHRARRIALVKGKEPAVELIEGDVQPALPR